MDSHLESSATTTLYYN